MTDASAALSTPISLLRPLQAAQTAKRAAISKTAGDYEASFLSTMLGQMFEGVQTSKPFGGGEGEDAYKSFMIDAYAKQMAKHGGVGVAHAVQREMLKMQGLS